MYNLFVRNFNNLFIISLSHYFANALVYLSTHWLMKSVICCLSTKLFIHSYFFTALSFIPLLARSFVLSLTTLTCCQHMFSIFTICNYFWKIIISLVFPLTCTVVRLIDRCLIFIQLFIFSSLRIVHFATPLPAYGILYQ